jgi:hypothetical protein
MAIQDKTIEYTARGKMKWWYWLMLISGSAMVIGGIISAIVL